MRNVGFRHKRYNKNGDLVERTTKNCIIPYSPKEVMVDNPTSIGNAGTFLKTKTLAYPLNPKTASILCLQILFSRPDMWSLFVANG